MSEEEKNMPRKMSISEERKRQKEKERKQEKMECFKGLPIDNITSNHGLPIQYFYCPYCKERHTGFDIFGSCDECGAEFKIMATKGESCD